MIGNTLGKIGKPINLQLMIKKDINTIYSFSVKDLFNFDKTIHKVRKSLKSISAILILYKDQFDQTQYLRLKSIVKALSKQFGILREPYVYLQTYHRIEAKLKNFDNSNVYELKYNLDLQYNLIKTDINYSKETVQPGKESILKLTEELHDLDVNFKYKLLNRELLKSSKKTRRLFKNLNLSSSSDKIHDFRKWCKIFYLQQEALNRVVSVKTSQQNKKLFKLTEYLGNEHDLQLFYQYLTLHFTELSKKSAPFFSLEIRKVRKKALALYPKISY